MNEPIPDTARRIQTQASTGFVTDDYWFFRTPTQPIIGEMLAKTITPEQAQIRLYEEVTKWVESRERLSQ